MSPPRKLGKQKNKQPEGITRITVKGFKSLANETSIEIRPLTILAGANSSGKSSIMQPLLLLKQTLDETVDVGAVKLHGPHVRFSNAAEMFSRDTHGKPCSRISAGFEDHRRWSIWNAWEPGAGHGVSLAETQYGMAGEIKALRADMTHEQVARIVEPELEDHRAHAHFEAARWRVARDRCFLSLAWEQGAEVGILRATPWGMRGSSEYFAERVRGIIHLSGHRGSPERVYRATAMGPIFPDTFEHYTASLVDAWQEAEPEHVVTLGDWLKRLGLASHISTRRPSDTEIEVLVSRLPAPSGKRQSDLVSIADVGFGVSQVLPVLVALRTAESGRLVYVEQPEMHLHPRAQIALAELLVDAANRGVRVVAETHSSLLLLAVARLVAAQAIAPDQAALHWFKRRKRDGVTEVTTAQVTETGAFGEWPEDFSEVEMEAQRAYLDEAHKRRRQKLGA